MLIRISLLVVSLCSLFQSATSQVTLELSSRYEWSNSIHQDELPPAIFFSFLPNINRHLSIGPELHFDLDLKKRMWPGVGEYQIREKNTGVGFQFRAHFNIYKFIYARSYLGAGIRNNARRRVTHNLQLSQYVSQPIDDGNDLYGYVMVGLEFELKNNWCITIDKGTGYQWVSLGCMYTFKTTENEK